ncbi:phosphoprotein ECPP44-like [Chenopodium quinoa]|uniref:phosphoprotein ECPP44-like n=1 Tax=Chenopodium quinoa TaxID=63459 RepID=UPI000B77F7FD|nr:phosphoprotein ECPP44-like [Chenopodium quinoa]
MSDQFENETTEINAKDRGLFDCFGKKEENPKEKVEKAEEEKVYLNSSSSSSSEEEVEEDGVKVKRKKKKGLTDKIKEKLPDHKDEAAATPVSDYDDHHQPATVTAEATHPEEKKGFLEMIKEKLPGHHKDDAVAPVPVPAPAPAPAAPQPPVVAHCGSDGQCGGSHEAQEKRGFLEKIKDKLPGGHKDSEAVKKDH